MKKVLALFTLFAVLVPALSFAADFRTDNVGKSENVRNVYVAGQNVNVDANVSGDLTSAGSTVNVNGSVEKSAQIAGSSLNIKGNIGDNLRVAGGTINLDGTVGEDLVVFGGQVNINQGAVIARDVIVFGGTVVINGNVNGKIIGSVGEMTINGTVGGDVDLKNVGKLTLGSNAVVNGKLTYASTQKSDIDESKIKDGVTFKQINQAEESRRGTSALGAFFFLSLIGSFLLLFVLVNLAPQTAERFVGISFLNPWANIGIGFVVLVVVPVALIFLLFSVIGIPFAGFGLLLYIFLLVLAGILMELLLGSLLIKVLNRSEVYPIDWLPILVGVIAVAFLKFIPLFGWIALFLLFLLSLGGLAKMIYLSTLEQRK